MAGDGTNYGHVTDARIDSLAALEQNWNSYGAPPPTLEALRVLRCLHVMPTNDGGVQIEWHCNGQDVEIEVGPNGLLDGMWWQGGGVKAGEVAPSPIDNAPTDLVEAIALDRLWPEGPACG